MPYNYYPKKPLKSFQDLEVYQKTLEASVILAKHADKYLRKKSKTSQELNELLTRTMLICALGIPHQIAEAHSLRFGDHTAAIAAGSSTSDVVATSDVFPPAWSIDQITGQISSNGFGLDPVESRSSSTGLIWRERILRM